MPSLARFAFCLLSLALGSSTIVHAQGATLTNPSPKPLGWIGIYAENKGDTAVVTNVAPSSPGAKAGIQAGDVILALDGRLLKGKDFETVVATLKPGTQVSVNYARGSSAHEVWITVGSGTVSPQQIPGTVQGRSSAPELTPLVSLSHPEMYGMAFLSFEAGKEGLGFMVTPDGKIGTVPMSKLAEAGQAGYRPLTAADLMAIINGVSEEETNLLKRFKELSDDYNGLVARYNRLAAVSTANPVQVRQSVDQGQAMRLMLFQNFLQRAFPGSQSQVQVQTVDCTKLPALCAH